MQRDGGDGRSARAERGERLGREVEPGGRRGDRPTLIGAILFTLLFPIVWLIWWIGRLGMWISRSKSSE